MKSGPFSFKVETFVKQNIYLYSTQTAFEQKKPKLESKFNPGQGLMSLNNYDRKIKEN